VQTQQKAEAKHAYISSIAQALKLKAPEVKPAAAADEPEQMDAEPIQPPADDAPATESSAETVQDESAVADAVSGGADPADSREAETKGASGDNAERPACRGSDATGAPSEMGDADGSTAGVAAAASVKGANNGVDDQQMDTDVPEGAVDDCVGDYPMDTAEGEAAGDWEVDGVNRDSAGVEADSLAGCSAQVDVGALSEGAGGVEPPVSAPPAELLLTDDTLDEMLRHLQ